jgi:hypothetical protein
LDFRPKAASREDLIVRSNCVLKNGAAKISRPALQLTVFGLERVKAVLEVLILALDGTVFGREEKMLAVVGPREVLLERFVVRELARGSL